MTRRIRNIVLILLACAVATPAAMAEEAGAAADGFAADLVADYTRAGGKLVDLAGAIPAEKYGWRPAEGVRSVSETFMHVVAVNYMLPGALGAAPPQGMEPPENPMAFMESLEKEVTAKDDVIAKLEASLEYGAGAIREIAAGDLEEKIALFGRPMSKRAYLFIILTHAHEHLGQSIAYARTNGVVPPWSQRPAEGEGDGG